MRTKQAIAAVAIAIALAACGGKTAPTSVGPTNSSASGSTPVTATVDPGVDSDLSGLDTTLSQLDQDLKSADDGLSQSEG